MKKNKFFYLFFLVLIFLIYAIAVISLIYSDHYSTDIKTHIRFAQKFLEYSLEGKLYFIPHPLFHVLLIGFHLIFGSWELSAAILLVFLIGLIFNIQILYISKELRLSFFSIDSIIFSFVLLIVSSIYIPPLNNWLSPQYFSVMFSGSGTPNILHNPTYYLVKVFVLPLFYFALKLLKNPSELNKRKIMFFTLFLSLSILAKPNFALSFIPVFAFLYTCGSIKEQNSIYQILKNLFLMFLLPVVILFLQFFVSYMAGPRDSNVSICFFCVWSHWSKIPLLSIFLGIGFPLYIYLLHLKRNLNDINYKFAWLNFLFALGVAIFFYETDYRLLAGNFFWGYNLSLFLLFYVSILDFGKYLKESYKNRNLEIRLYGAIILLVLHIAGGIYHFSIYMN